MNLIYYRYDNKPMENILQQGFLGTRHTDVTFIPFGGNSVFSSCSKVGAANFLKEIYNHEEYFTPLTIEGYKTSSIFNLYRIEHTGRTLNLHEYSKTYKRCNYSKGILRYLIIEEYLKPLLIQQPQYRGATYEVLTRMAFKLAEKNKKLEIMVDNYLRVCAAYTKEVILEGPIPPGNVTWMGKVDISNARFLTLDY
ncbi:hypothetical protein [Cedecea sp.]|jgi:hypothetical protein|uniref:hypothetical protein n=1 Tax=Cedecea sp. TaxID=1970739 RepID=UPI002F3F9E9B